MPGYGLTSKGINYDIMRDKGPHGHASQPQLSTHNKGGRVSLKKGGNGKWIQKAVKGMRKDKPCTGDKFGSASCPPGSKRYNLAKTFKKMGKKRKAA